MSTKGSKIAYFDCFSGISGDMTLGALLDCGLELAQLQEMLARLPLGGYRLEAARVSRYSLAGTDLQVILEEEGPPLHRHLSDIEALIDNSTLPGAVKEKSRAVFTRLAEAEAAVHGTTIDEVHFHEVGAVDAIVDIVGSVAAMHLLRIERLYCSPLPLGGGSVTAAHGLLPLPAPATLRLLQQRRAPVYGRETDHELVTPTGAAIVTALAAGFGAPPPFHLEQVGYGSGKLDPGYANYLRIFVGTPRTPHALQQESMQIIEANIDDLNPEISGYLMEQLFAGGAWDVFFTPVQMKKNRPAVKLTVLAPPQHLSNLVEIVFQESSTMGLRVLEAQKYVQPRETVTVTTEWGPVRIKLAPGGAGAEPRHFAAEYEDCAKIARQTGVPLKKVFRSAERSFARQLEQAGAEPPPGK